MKRINYCNQFLLLFELIDEHIEIKFCFFNFNFFFFLFHKGMEMIFGQINICFVILCNSGRKFGCLLEVDDSSNNENFLNHSKKKNLHLLKN